MSIQRRNSASENLLSATFQRRLEPNFALANMIPTYQALPELRGLWSASVVDDNGALRDLAIQGRTLTNNGAAPRGIDGLVPYVSYNGSSQYHSRADESGLDITGNLTIGGWFYATSFAATPFLIGKDVPGTQRSYSVYTLPSGAGWFGIFPLGTNASTISVTSSNVVTTGSPYFIVGRYTTSTELAIFLNGTKTTNTTGIAASNFNSTSALTIATLGSLTQYLPGRMYNCFLSASAISDAILRNLFEQTRAAFGV